MNNYGWLLEIDILNVMMKGVLGVLDEDDGLIVLHGGRGDCIEGVKRGWNVKKEKETNILKMAGGGGMFAKGKGTLNKGGRTTLYT